MRFRLASMLVFALLAGLPMSAGAAQNDGTLQKPETPVSPDAQYVAPAHVAFVEGSATLERDGRPETAPLNMPLLSGDRLKTLNGRVEVLFGDGSAMHIDSETTVDLQSEELMRLIDGRLRLAVAGARGADSRSAGVVYRVDSPAGSVRVLQTGEYRVALLRRGDERQLELAVVRGSAEIFTDEGTTMVRAGERAYASAGLAPSYAYAYNSANWDAFDRWSEARRDTRLGASTQYLPTEVRAYASTFDEDGDWRYNAPYGYVWYPRVAVGWRPYYYGRWAPYPRYGWTWIGVDRFAWPTHHYGRWGFSVGSWFWIPGRHWAPAHVSWAYAPGYVSWCPLGFNNRPVIAVNLFNVGPGYYSSWNAWTAVGYSHFGHGYVHHRAVNWNRYSRGAHPSFRVGPSGPAYRSVAVPRSSTTAQGAPSNAEGRSSPISTVGSRTPVTSTAPRYINRGDAIVRSRTGRPSGSTQSATGFDTAVPRGTSPAPGSVVERTAPAGPARSIDSPAASTGSQLNERTRIGRDAGIASTPASPYERGRVTAPQDAPAFTPRSPYERYGGERAVPRSSPMAPSVPSTGAGAPTNVERRGYESRPAPGGAVERQGPSPRAMPGPDRSAPSGGGVAVPRGSGGPSAAPPAPAPTGAGSGARAPRGGRGGR